MPGFQGYLPLDHESIEQHYPADEVSMLWQLIESMRDMPVAERNRQGLKILKTFWDDELTFISRTFWIQTKDGTSSLLKPNYAQQRLHKDAIRKCELERRPIRVIILKARQLGFSTFIQAYQYVKMLLNQDRNSLTVSYDEDSTNSLLAKATYAHGRTWFPPSTKYDTKTHIEFSPPHSSAFRGITAGNMNLGRGATYQHVHCSEIPMWPDPSGTLAGMQQAIPQTPLSSVIWESTARGVADPFYEGWNLAEKGRSSFVPFFAPWYWDPDYATDFRTPELRKNFLRRMPPSASRLQRDLDLTLEQMHWRQNKIDEPDMTAKMFQQEYPSYPEEAFITSGSPVFDLETILEMGRHATPPIWRGNVALERVE